MITREVLSGRALVVFLTALAVSSCTGKSTDLSTNGVNKEVQPMVGSKMIPSASISIW